MKQRPWTEYELDRACRWRRDDELSAAEIGRRLHRTRNSVVGALHRAKEPGVLVNATGRRDGGPRRVRPIPMRFSEQVHG